MKKFRGIQFTCIDELNVDSPNHRKLIKRSVLRGKRLDEISLSELRYSKDPKKVILDTVLEQFSKVKEEIDNYIDRNGVMKTVAGVPITVVGGLWK